MSKKKKDQINREKLEKENKKKKTCEKREEIKLKEAYKNLSFYLAQQALEDE